LLYENQEVKAYWGEAKTIMFAWIFVRRPTRVHFRSFRYAPFALVA
jgi:hypothetical protein